MAVGTLTTSLDAALDLLEEDGAQVLHRRVLLEYHQARAAADLGRRDEAATQAGQRLAVVERKLHGLEPYLRDRRRYSHGTIRSLLACWLHLMQCRAMLGRWYRL